ncbi:YafY family protein [Marinilabilia salmonicolor]|jgi:predicted DNA-binding transcriptional regulator YafY|uniref:Putative DNA-binding transcriptional regulator YafY n=1 Tax=Marinilabilia salmonicolor TaxID=989 RepID=A0A2T0XH46_9BACT|nr:WYL domain-containing protein [Marinilabilia salmonicolor]PRY98279.1 putative DNA-binding transcriptional regulator YafY [Marinilabilia salmonicolor]RCW33853.1 putative DNA-binding transcriptional regulator YafY [Marinilabilia salmonicolor]
MSTRETLQRHTIIINRLRKSDASFEEIADKLELESELQGYDFNISKRTFQRDIENIESLYGISIKFNFSRNAWYIEEVDNTEANARLLEAFDTFNALKMTNRLPQYIDYEKRRPRGTENMNGLLHAIQNNLRVSFTYQKYWIDEKRTRYVEPLALKESINRWYVITMDAEKKEIRTFALDRLSELEITNEKFNRPEDFDVNEMFKYSFGIISGVNFEPEDVLLAFRKPQAEYIRSLKLHHSQDVVKETKEEILFSMKLFITEDFVQEIVSQGSRVKVLQPDSLIHEVKRYHQEAMDLY